MKKKLADYDCIHLVRNVNDPGTRLNVAPKMKRITVDAVEYVRTTNSRVEYEDGKVGVTYVANVPMHDFFPGTKK